MPKPILAGFDPKRGDRAPVEFGAAASRFFGAPLIVASVYADDDVVDQLGRRQMDEDLAAEADGALADVRRELEAEGLTLECRAIPGTSAPGALHRAAEESGAGLVVVGSTDRGQLSRVLPGSTAERLMHGAPCPVVVVPHGWHPRGGISRLGIAYTETPEGRVALESGLAVARRAGAKVRVLTAVKPRHFGRAAGGRPGAEVTTFDEAGAEREEVARDVVALAAELAPGVEVEIDVSAQDAAEFLIATSEHLDLLVCGSRGYGPPAAVLLGGVSRKVTAAARCPVIVLARGADDGLLPLVDDQAGAAA